MGFPFPSLTAVLCFAHFILFEEATLNEMNEVWGKISAKSKTVKTEKNLMWETVTSLFCHLPSIGNSSVTYLCRSALEIFCCLVSFSYAPFFSLLVGTMAILLILYGESVGFTKNCHRPVIVFKNIARQIDHLLDSDVVTTH